MSFDPEKCIEFLAAHQPQKAPWNNGDVIEVGTTRDYHAFEEGLIEYVPHNAGSELAWPGRKSVDQLITPKGFYGRICDISLVYTDAPYEYMQAQSLHRHSSSLTDTAQTPGYSFGFAMQAKLHSTKGGNVGSLDVFLAYAYPNLFKTRSYYQFGNLSGAGMVGIRRVVSKPAVIVDRPLYEIRAKSVQTAAQLDRRAIKYPYMGATETARRT